MPNKTIYVSEDDLALYERAKAISGSNLSATISLALERYTEQAATDKPFSSITLRVGKIAYAIKRFEGRLLAKGIVPAEQNKPGEAFEVYETSKGNFAVYHAISPKWSLAPGPEGSYLAGQTEYRLDTCENLDELPVPEELAEVVRNIVEGNEVEDLDI